MFLGFDAVLDADHLLLKRLRQIDRALRVNAM